MRQRRPSSEGEDVDLNLKTKVAQLEQQRLVRERR